MTLEQKKAFRDRAEAAYLKAMDAASYNVNLGGTGRSLSRQDLNKLHDKFLYWQNEVDKEENNKTGIPTKYGTSIE